MIGRARVDPVCIWYTTLLSEYQRAEFHAQRILTARAAPTIQLWDAGEMEDDWGHIVGTQEDCKVK
jgi:hypothetical protein